MPAPRFGLPRTSRQSGIPALSLAPGVDGKSLVSTLNIPSMLAPAQRPAPPKRRPLLAIQTPRTCTWMGAGRGSSNHSCHLWDPRVTACCLMTIEPSSNLQVASFFDQAPCPVSIVYPRQHRRLRNSSSPSPGPGVPTVEGQLQQHLQCLSHFLPAPRLATHSLARLVLEICPANSHPHSHSSKSKSFLKGQLGTPACTAKYSHKLFSSNTDLDLTHFASRSHALN